MKDLNETSKTLFLKSQKVIKMLDKVINGDEKQLVLEIGNHATKLVEYVVKKDTIEVTNGFVINTPINSVENDRISDSTALSNVLAQSIKQAKIKTKEFVASISSKEIITREMNVPPMQPKDLKSFVIINSNSIFPVKLSNYVLGYNIIETNRIMIAAIPKEIVNSYIGLGTKLGLNLKGINYSGYELYNFLDFEIGNTKEAYLAFDIGAKNTNIIVISNSILKFNKIIPKGAQETTEYISEELKCSLTKAEQLKRLYNTLEVSQDGNAEELIVAKYTKRNMDNILQDINRILDFYNSNNSKNKITKVYIIGACGKIKGIEEYFTQKLNIETKSLKNLKNVIYSASALPLKARQLNIINCLGANQLNDKEFNVIKGDLNIKRLSFVLTSKFHKLMISLVLIVIFSILFLNKSITSIHNKIDEYERYLEAKSDILSLKDEIEDKENELYKYNELLGSIEKGAEAHIENLELIEKAAKELSTEAKIIINNYEVEKKSIEFRGFVELPSQVSDEYATDPKYKKLPFELKKLINEYFKENIDVTVTSNLNTAANNFLIKINFK